MSGRQTGETPKTRLFCVRVSLPVHVVIEAAGEDAAKSQAIWEVLARLGGAGGASDKLMASLPVDDMKRYPADFAEIEA